MQRQGMGPYTKHQKSNGVYLGSPRMGLEVQGMAVLTDGRREGGVPSIHSAQSARASGLEMGCKRRGH